jgi:hypothetical protein
MVPSNESFAADQPVFAQVQEWLEGQAKLAPMKRVA